MSPTQQEFEAQLTRDGIDKVRADITTGVYLGGLNNLAEAWLDKETYRLSNEDNREQSRIARSAKNAAWIAAIAAIIAAICAIISIWPQILAWAMEAATHLLKI